MLFLEFCKHLSSSISQFSHDAVNISPFRPGTLRTLRWHHLFNFLFYFHKLINYKGIWKVLELIQPIISLYYLSAIFSNVLLQNLFHIVVALSSKRHQRILSVSIILARGLFLDQHDVGSRSNLLESYRICIQDWHFQDLVIFFILRIFCFILIF